MSVQVIRCPCGKAFAGCVTDHMDDDWYRDVGEYVTKGCKLSVQKNLLLEDCQCPDMDGSFKDQLRLEL